MNIDEVSTRRTFGPHCGDVWNERPASFDLLDTCVQQLNMFNVWILVETSGRCSTPDTGEDEGW